MNERVKTLSDAASSLPPAERAELVDHILSGLEESDPRIENLWTEEARDRLAALDRGELKANELSDVLARLSRRR